MKLVSSLFQINFKSVRTPHQWTLLSNLNTLKHKYAQLQSDLIVFCTNSRKAHNIPFIFGCVESKWSFTYTRPRNFSHLGAELLSPFLLWWCRLNKRSASHNSIVGKCFRANHDKRIKSLSDTPFSLLPVSTSSCLLEIKTCNILGIKIQEKKKIFTKTNHDYTALEIWHYVL